MKLRRLRVFMAASYASAFDPSSHLRREHDAPPFRVHRPRRFGVTRSPRTASKSHSQLWKAHNILSTLAVGAFLSCTRMGSLGRPGSTVSGTPAAAANA